MVGMISIQVHVQRAIAKLMKIHVNMMQPTKSKLINEQSVASATAAAALTNDSNPNYKGTHRPTGTSVDLLIDRFDEVGVVEAPVRCRFIDARGRDIEILLKR